MLKLKIVRTFKRLYEKCFLWVECKLHRTFNTKDISPWEDGTKLYYLLNRTIYWTEHANFISSLFTQFKEFSINLYFYFCTIQSLLRALVSNSTFEKVQLEDREVDEYTTRYVVLRTNHLRTRKSRIITFYHVEKSIYRIKDTYIFQIWFMIRLMS